RNVLQVFFHAAGGYDDGLALGRRGVGPFIGGERETGRGKDEPDGGRRRENSELHDLFTPLYQQLAQALPTCRFCVTTPKGVRQPVSKRGPNVNSNWAARALRMARSAGRIIGREMGGRPSDQAAACPRRGE